MEHVLKNPLSHVTKAYPNSKGNTECVEFIRQTLEAPPTSQWTQGRTVRGDNTIPQGTAIATFVNGQYPQQGSTGKHAAIYLSQDAVGVWVVDQWRSQGKVGSRRIPFNPTRAGLSNDGKAFSVIDW